MEQLHVNSSPQQYKPKTWFDFHSQLTLAPDMDFVFLQSQNLNANTLLYLCIYTLRAFYQKKTNKQTK